MRGVALVGTVLALTLAACSAAAAPGTEAPSAAASPRVITIEANDQLKFVPAAVTVQKGETVVFRVVNSGTVDHEFMVGPKDAVAADSKDGTAELEGLKGGETKELTYTFPDAGDFAFACHEEGHFEAGMVGTVTVTP